MRHPDIVLFIGAGRMSPQAQHFLVVEFAHRSSLLCVLDDASIEINRNRKSSSSRDSRAFSAKESGLYSITYFVFSLWNITWEIWSRDFPFNRFAHEVDTVRRAFRRLPGSVSCNEFAGLGTTVV